MTVCLRKIAKIRTGGPRASECPEVYETVKEVLTAVLPVFDTSGKRDE